MTDIDAELDNIFETYGYFLGLAYEDKDGNMATRNVGEVKQQLHHLLARVAREARIDEMQSLKNQTRKWYDNRAMISVESQNQSMAVHTNSLIEYRLATLQKEANHE